MTLIPSSAEGTDVAGVAVGGDPDVLVSLVKVVGAGVTASKTQPQAPVSIFAHTASTGATHLSALE